MKDLNIVPDGCMVTSSGIIFNLMKPDIELITIEDIAHGLSNTCRWNGHTRYFYSVAEHCCILYDNANDGHKPTALFHDSEESYWFDAIAPIKKILAKTSHSSELLNRMEELRALIFKKYGISPINAYIHKADLQLRDLEYRELFTNRKIILSCWKPITAKREWLKRFNVLRKSLYIKNTEQYEYK